MDEDAELQAIRARLRAEILAGRSAAPPGPPPLDRPVDLTDATLADFVQEHDVAVVDCWAPWCGPCRIVGPIVEDLARELAGRVAFGKLNVDENPRASEAFLVRSIPTMLVFRGGQLADRIVGALPKPQLAAAIQRSGGRPARSPGPRRL